MSLVDRLCQAGAVAPHDMPKRPRSHQTGDAAAPRWQILLEPHFVFRSETPDYGIDGEAEEFDDEGRATGLRYKVQLKSTGEQELRKALRVPVSISNANYWRAQDLPVLLVRYHRPSDRFFVRWFHTFDPHDGDVASTGITFQWKEADVWREGRAEELASEARAFLELRSSRVRLPFSFGLQVADGVDDPSEPEIRIALRAAARARPDVVRLLPGLAAPGQGRLIVTADRLVVDLGGVTSTTIPLATGRSARTAKQVAVDLLSLAALAFERVGQADLAGRLASSYLAGSNVIEHPEAPWALSGAMVRARRIDEALTLADEIDAQPHDEDPSLWFTLPVLFHSGSLVDREKRFAIEVLSRRIERRHERGDSIEEARACVNLANFFRSRGEPLRSIPLYDQALECDPAYAERPHFWEEKAGVLFGAHRYDEAAEAYGQALKLGASPLARALEADALLFAGRYSEAQERLQRFVTEETVRAQQAEYLLKLDLIHDIIKVLGLVEQARGETSPTSPLVAGDEPPSLEDAQDLALAALQHDALDPRGWALLGWVGLKRGNLAIYARYLRAVACLLGGDVDAWVNAVTVNHGVPGGTWVPEMLVTGERMTEGHLLPALAAFARDSVPVVERANWLSEVEALAHSIPADDSHDFAVRFIGQDGAMETLRIPGVEDGDFE